MTLVADCLTEEHNIQVAQAQQDGAKARYANGLDDAAFGRRPEYADDAYLAGYVAQLKQLPTRANGRIIHYSPRQHFAFGFMDGSDGESDLAYV
jgi:hypothetical protein